MTSSSPVFKIDPPLLNSATPWATTIDEIRDLYNSPHTGAVTIRTSLLAGFKHDPEIHQYTFFSPSIGSSTAPIGQDGQSEVLPNEPSSLNTLGYSPTPLGEYLDLLSLASKGLIEGFRPRLTKPLILSVTGSPDAVAQCHGEISRVQSENDSLSLMMEINLSCPNIPDKPPPAYDAASLTEYLTALARAKATTKTKTSSSPDRTVVLCGIKTPPYTHQAQYTTLLSALEESARPSNSSSNSNCPISFITATNTLGSCLVLGLTGAPALKSASGQGVGGLAGASLHPLALGNVLTLRTMLDASSEALASIAVVGVGGVSDRPGYERMRSVGAAAVGVGTALGRDGVEVFARIWGGAG